MPEKAISDAISGASAVGTAQRIARPLELICNLMQSEKKLK